MTAPGSQAVSAVNIGLGADEIRLSGGDGEVLRRLAERVARIAADPLQEELRDLWRRHNGLERTRPLVFCDPENGWNEIVRPEDLECSSPLGRLWEMRLRKEIFWGEEMGDDRPVEPCFDVMYVYRESDWGVREVIHSGTGEGASYCWDAPIQDYDKDLAKLRSPVLTIDRDATDAALELARDAFGDLLQVRLKGKWWWSLGLTRIAIRLRGLENMMVDFLLQPDGVRELLAFISQSLMRRLDYLEENHLLSLNNDGTYVGSGGFGYSEELPGEDFDGRHVRCADLWGFAESQETVQVSPEHYAEFVFPCEKPLLDRFGLNCYGCCEPIDLRWQVLEGHRNLRRLSVSPWADLEKMAEYLGNDYIFSMKPNPSPLSRPDMDREEVRRGLRRALEITKDCVLEVVMKDNHTLGGDKRNAIEWVRIAKEEIARARGA